MCAAGKRSLLEESVETNDETACLPNGLNLEERRCCVTKWTDLQKKSQWPLFIDVVSRTSPGLAPKQPRRPARRKGAECPFCPKVDIAVGVDSAAAVEMR